MVVGLFVERGRGPHQWCRSIECTNSGGAVACEYTGLGLANPIPTRTDPWLRPLQTSFVGAHGRGSAAQPLDQRKQTDQALDDEVEVRLAGEGQRGIGLPLNVVERRARCEGEC